MLGWWDSRGYRGRRKMDGRDAWLSLLHQNKGHEIWKPETWKSDHTQEINLNGSMRDRRLFHRHVS